MKSDKYEKGLAELRAELALSDDMSIPPMERLKHTLPLISGIIGEIRKEVLAEGFVSVEAEIHFFKFVKPAYYALQIFETDFYNLNANLPPGTNEMRKAYYEEELLYVLRVFRLHAFHYQYFRTGARELDSAYFTREGSPGDVPILSLSEPQPGFSAPLDYLFAKFIAAERMQILLVDKLTILYGQQPAKSQKATSKLKWTGDTINLVELAYGIWLTGQVNGGQASMAEITRFLEEVFGVHIGDPNRRWQDISRRKSISPTKFLELSISEINKRIDNERSLIRK